MNGRPRKKYLLIEHYTACPNNYHGEHIYQLNHLQLLNNSIKTGQYYHNNYPPYNLLFEALEEKELFFLDDDAQEIEARMRSSLATAFVSMSPKEERVLKLFYGLDDNIVRTAPKVASEFRVKVDEVKKAKAQAIKKLRSSSKKRVLSKGTLIIPNSSSEPEGYPYTLYCRKLYLKTFPRRTCIYSQIEDSFEKIFTLVLSNVYPKQLIARYFELIKVECSWLSRTANKELIYGTQLSDLGLNEKLGGILYQIIKENDFPVNLWSLYVLYMTGILKNQLESADEIGPIRQKAILDTCDIFYKRLGLLQETDTPYSGDFFKEAVCALEVMSIENKSSIVSPYIPTELVEILLNLNYRAIEELVSEYLSGDLKKRCDAKYSKIILGDIYDTISQAVEMLIKKPVNYTRIQLVDYEEVPEQIRRSLKEAEDKQNFFNEQDTNQLDDLFDIDIDGLDEFLDVDDLLDVGIEMLEESAAKDTLIIDLDIPLWAKHLFNKAGFIDVGDILSKQLGFADLVIDYNIGLLAAEKFCNTLDDLGVRLKDCSKVDYPNISIFLKKQREQILKQMFDEEIRPVLVAEFKVQSIFEENGTECYSTQFYYSKGKDFSDWKYVAVPIGNSTGVGVGMVTNIRYLFPNKLPDLFENLDFVIRKAEKQEYLDRIQKYHARLLEMDEQPRRITQEKSESVVMTRKQLYDEVWELSMSGVARKYGIQYSKCVKQIKEANIPTPTSSYWTMLSLGKPVEKPPLDEPFDEIVILTK